MTSKEQLDMWANGKSLHRGVRDDKDSECCPDFSCCKPELAVDMETRRKFVAGDETVRTKMLGDFLANLLAHHVPRKRVYIAGRGPV